MGETIAFNPADGLIYRAYGSGVPNTDQFLVSVDPVTLAVTNIPLSVDSYNQATALTHWAGNFFLMADHSKNLFVVSSSGQVRLLSTLQSGVGDTKGLVFSGTPPACPPLAPLYGAANLAQSESSHGMSLLYSLDPASGAPTLIGPIGFERVSGIAFNASGTLFGTGERRDGGVTSVLLTINPCTGAGTEVGPTGIGTLEFSTITDISFSPPVAPDARSAHPQGAASGTSTLFAVLAQPPTLGMLDTSTGQATVGDWSSFASGSGNGLAFSPSGILFHADNQNLNQLDPATGSVTIAIPLTFPASIVENFNRVNAMDFQPGTGVLFASVNASAANYLGTIDTATGIVSLFDTEGGPAQTQPGLDAIAFSPALVGPPTAVRVETKADGSGTVVPAQNVTAGSTVTGYAISRDSSGNFVANVAATWSLANATGGVVSGDLVTAGDSKSATFTGHLVGTAAMHAVVSGLTSTDSGTLTVVTGAPGTITATGGTPQRANINTAYTAALQATVKDSGGNLVPGATVTFTAPGSGASGTFAGGANTAATNASGVATSATFTANSASGSYTVNATVPGVATPATFALANVDISIASASGTQTVAAGGTANYTLNFTAITDKSVNPTTFACQNLPASAACVFNPASLPADSPNTPFGLGISTTARPTAASIGSGGGFGLPLGVLPAAVLALLAMIAMSLASFSKRAPRFAPSRVAAFGMLVLMVGYIAGCGAVGTGFPARGSAGVQGTPAGTYTVTVVATSGTLQRTTTVSLTVQ